MVNAYVEMKGDRERVMGGGVQSYLNLPLGAQNVQSKILISHLCRNNVYYEQ